VDLANLFFITAIFSLMASFLAGEAFLNFYLRAAIFFATLSAAFIALFL